jgi:hypothetical protein
LLDAVKTSRATAGSEHEVVISIANAMELFMVGNGDLVVQEQLAAGLSLDQRTTYSALGAAVKFLPIQKIQYWVINRLAAEIVDQRMLGIADDHRKNLQRRGNDFAVENGLTLEGMGQAVISTVPIEFRAAGDGSVLPTFGLRDSNYLLPTILQHTGPRRRHRPLVEWYRLLNAHREELLRNEQVTTPIQQQTTPQVNWIDDSGTSRQLGIWRLYMHLEGGTAEEIGLQTMNPHAPGLFIATHNNLSVLLTSSTDQSQSSSPITSAQVIPYSDGYLGLPITDIRRQTGQMYRQLVGLDTFSGENARTVVDRLQNSIVRQTCDILTGDNKGLESAQAWLRGILTRIHDELERLPHDDRAEQTIQADWSRRLIALEQTLGGRPGPNGEPETRGLAQQRPEPSALLARALTAAGFLLFWVITFFRRVQPVELSRWQTVGLVAGLIGFPFLLAGLFGIVYEIRAARFRRRALVLVREQIDRQITLSTINAVEAVLRRSYQTVSDLLTGLSHDIQAAELWRDENLGARELQIEGLSDTILREAIGDPDLVNIVGQLNRKERDEMLERIGVLWKWVEWPAQDAVSTALTTYASFTPVTLPPSAAAGQPAAPPAQPPHTLIWEWLEDAIRRVSGRFVNQQIPYSQNIETYIARHPRAITGFGAETDDTSFESDPFDAQSYLIDMGFLAKPYIFLEEVELTQPVVSIDLLGVDREERARFDRNFLGDLRSDPRWSMHPPRLVSTYDPFSITYLRTLHGLPIRSMSRWQRYSDSFANLGVRDRELLEVLPTNVYVKRVIPEGKSLFFGLPYEQTAGNGHDTSENWETANNSEQG